MTTQKKKLNLGSGKDYRRGWLNVDLGATTNFGGKIKLDVAHDLNNYPFPFEDSQFNEVFMRGILEHLDVDKTMKEIRRITKTGAKITINVPHFTSYFAYRELGTHKFSLRCSQVFWLFKKNDLRLRRAYFENNNLALRWVAHIVNFTEFTKSFYERFLTGFFQMNQIVWEVVNTKEK